MKHAYLYGAGKQVLDYCPDLQGDDLCRDVICLHDTRRILDGYGSNGGQRMGPKAENGLYISLNPCSAA
jgi:hypothetical protein